MPYGHDAQKSELHVASLSFDKLKTGMRSLGFQEGLAKGRDSAVQEGFNSGYLSGFTTGRHLGFESGIIRCQQELKQLPSVGAKLKSDELEFKALQDKACILCANDCNEAKTQAFSFENIIMQQQRNNEEIIGVLQKLNLSHFM